MMTGSELPEGQPTRPPPTPSIDSETQTIVTDRHHSTELRCPDVVERIRAHREKSEEKSEDKCITYVKVVVELTNLETEHISKILLVTRTLSYRAPENKVIVIGWQNNDYHGWWQWNFFNGMVSLTINFSTESQRKGSDHVFLDQDNVLRYTDDGEMSTLVGVNCNEVIVAAVMRAPEDIDEVDQYIITPATAGHKFDLLISQALHLTPPEVTNIHFTIPRTHTSYTLHE